MKGPMVTRTGAEVELARLRNLVAEQHRRLRVARSESPAAPKPATTPLPGSCVKPRLATAVLNRLVDEARQRAELLNTALGTALWAAWPERQPVVPLLRPTPGLAAYALRNLEGVPNLVLALFWRRPDEIEAARALVVQNQANVDQARKKLDDLMPVAPEDALVENTFFNVGEWVPAGSPVVSLLPDFRVKLRFFVPEEDVARARPGNEVSFTCDSCPSGLKATIIYVSPRAEYTPPVIYSQSARTKLVFLVEARPTKPAMPLQPGLPIVVESFATAP